MESDIPLIDIPEDLLPIIGTPDPGTRIYRTFGTDDSAFALWWDTIVELGMPYGMISPGGVSLYARVSRPGVHKRLREGRMTAFIYHKVRVINLFGLLTVDRIESECCNIPVSEAKAWGELLRQKTPQEQYSEAVGDGDREGLFLSKVPVDVLERWRDKRRREQHK